MTDLMARFTALYFDPTQPTLRRSLRPSEAPPLRRIATALQIKLGT